MFNKDGFTSNYQIDQNSILINEDNPIFQTFKSEISFVNPNGNIDLLRWEKLQGKERDNFKNLPFVKFDKELKLLLNSDIILEKTFIECIKEINSSSGAFALDIISLEVEMNNDFDDEYDILINVKVPEEAQFEIVDKFWNCISLRVKNIIEDLKVRYSKADELYDRLFVIVDY